MELAKYVTPMQAMCPYTSALLVGDVPENTDQTRPRLYGEPS
jgi:hypothetical protein